MRSDGLPDYDLVVQLIEQAKDLCMAARNELGYWRHAREQYNYVDDAIRSLDYAASVPHPAYEGEEEQ